MWQIEYTDEFEKWWNELSQEAQKDVASVVGLLEEWGASRLSVFFEDKGRTYGSPSRIAHSEFRSTFESYVCFRPQKDGSALAGRG